MVQIQHHGKAPSSWTASTPLLSLAKRILPSLLIIGALSYALFGIPTSNSNSNSNSIMSQQPDLNSIMTTAHAHQERSTAAHHSSLRQQQQQLFQLPIVPSLKTSNADAEKAIDDFFHRFTNHNKGGGGWININALRYEDVKILRDTGKNIMGQNLACGRPNVSDNDIISHHRADVVLAPGLEFCFWESDLVSGRALDNFLHERHLWQWVIREFRQLHQELPLLFGHHDAHNNNTSNSNSNSNVANNKSAYHYCQLGFLDVGVNVGDWASPIRMALPNVPYFGIEGTPSTGAIAAANMRTANEHHIRHHASSSSSSSSSDVNSESIVAPMALLPFSLVSKGMLKGVQNRGGICFNQVHGNVGGQSVNSIGTGDCSPSVTAGATLLPHALQAVAPLQASSSISSSSSSSSSSHTCPGWQVLDWPRIYIAKVDIEGFEFKALNSAMDWLIERPPCYVMIEFYNEPHVTAIIELLLDVGYDSLWRTHNNFARNESFMHDEYPRDRPPYWSRSQNSTVMKLQRAVAADLEYICCFKDYLFGFEDKKKCLNTLLE